MTRKQANIRPELVGELFLKPGEDIPYRLILCNTEPTAQIQRVDRTTPDDLVGISGLSGLVLLKPVHPIEKAKKPRADKGGTHRKPKTEPATITPVKKNRGRVSPVETETADKKDDNLIIHVPTGLGSDTEYHVNITGSAASGPTLRLTVMEALLPDDGKIPECLNEQEKETIQGILDAGSD